LENIPKKFSGESQLKNRKTFSITISFKSIIFITHKTTMIIDSNNGRDYPTGSQFKVSAWTCEKLEKNIRILNSNWNILLNLM